MRRKRIERNTKETQIVLALEIDGTGAYEINTGCGFFDHMLTLFASHGKFDLIVNCKGDTNVDYHHSVEDIGICLGQAFSESVGNAKGIYRYGSMILPMDEALILCAVDFSGRDCLVNRLSVPTERIGDFDTELVEEFFLAFVRNAKISLHFQQLEGKNAHHIIECMFKSVARSIRRACELDSRACDKIPSTKGVLS